MKRTRNRNRVHRGAKLRELALRKPLRHCNLRLCDYAVYPVQ